MSAERWQRLRALYDQALDATPAERDRLVQHVSESDPDLAGELRRLLVASDSDTTFLDTPLARLAPPEFEPGIVLCDRFDIRRRIGRGGMGEVWLAHDRQLQEDVALKTIRPAAVGDDRALARFKREIQLARRIAHPNVCRVHELFEDASVSPSRFFLTMELFEGETLGDRLKRDGAIPAPEALAIAGEVAAGLAAAHDAGVVHRDLKPANIMLVEGASHRRAVILDFGLARSETTPTLSGGSTVAGTIVGTPEYMAPEQISNGDVTPATDVYALGLILFEMLRGRRAFDAASTLESWMRRAREGPERLSGVVPGVAARIDQVIGRCLEYDPARRYPTARELSRALTSKPVVTLPMSPRRLGWVAAAVLAVSALAGAGAWVWTRVPPPPRAVLDGYEDALEALAEGASVRARNLINRVIEQAPDWAPAHAALAEVQLELERPSLAQAAILRANELLRDRGRVSREDRRYVEGMTALVQRDCETAIARFRERARAAPDRTQPYRSVSTARAMERCLRLDDAESEMAHAAVLDPRNAAVPLRMARIVASRSNYTEAFAALDGAEKLFLERNNSEGRAETLVLRGTFQVEQDRLASADITLAEAWSRAADLDGARLKIRVLIQRAIASRKRRDIEKAIEATTEAMALAREHDLETLAIEALFATGNVLMTANRFSEAELYFERARQISETHRHDDFKARATFSLASLDVRRLQPGRAGPLAWSAKAHYERIGDLRNSTTVDLLIGEIHTARGEYPEATARLESALKSIVERNEAAQEPLARERLGTAFAAAGRYREALEQFEKVVSILRTTDRASLTFARLNIADVSSRVGLFPEAATALEAARGDNNHSADLRAQILRIAADLELRRGRYDEALSLARESAIVGAGLSLERTLKARLTACLARARSGRGMHQGDCEGALDEVRKHENLALLQEARLTVAEALIRAGRRQDAVALLTEVERQTPPLLSSEERFRLMALSAAASGTPAPVASMTRIESALRLKWQPESYEGWASRDDVRRWRALAQGAGNTTHSD